MANRPTLTEIKMHSRIDTDYEDDYLVALDNSAFDFIRTYLNRDLVLDNTAELTEGQIYYTSACDRGEAGLPPCGCGAGNAQICVYRKLLRALQNTRSILRKRCFIQISVKAFCLYCWLFPALPLCGGAFISVSFLFRNP